MLKSVMMKKLTVSPILALVAVIMLCSQSHVSDAAQENRMNVLFLVVDDLNSWLLGDTKKIEPEHNKL
jgi:hypothetical protein